MQSFSWGAVARVPFPQVERDRRQNRPALVVAVFDLPNPLLWVLMITSAENEPWEGDIPIVNFAEAGLPAPSVIRTAKIGTVEMRQSEFAGRVSNKIMAKVERRLAATFAAK
ncbi:MAG: type II toxin-antitoxin system PemK/MazF family toxin [Devosia sp.]